MARIAVLMPVRNAAASLDEAMESLAAQTFRDWEAVVVDDGSSDDTPRLLRAWTRRDSRVRVLTHRTGRGIVPSLRRALGRVKSPLVARMDGDDISLPRRFELQLRLLEEGTADVAGCRVRYFPEELVRDGSRRYQAWLNSLTTPEEHERDIFVECPLAHPTLLLPTDVLRAAGGYRDPGWAEDYELLLRLWRRGRRIAKVPEVLFLWREGPERTSRTRPEYAPEAFLRCKAHYLARTCLRGRSALVFGAGPVGKSVARALLEEGVTLAGFADLDPRKIGQQVYGVPVLASADACRLAGGPFGLGAVGQPGAREELRATLRAAGWVEGRDFRCVA